MAPGFGNYFTDHMVEICWTDGRGWHGLEIGPYRLLTLDPAARVLHYGQAIFEGLKAYRQPDGVVLSFRPEANAARFRPRPAGWRCRSYPTSCSSARCGSWWPWIWSGCLPRVARSRCTCAR